SPRRSDCHVRSSLFDASMCRSSIVFALLCACAKSLCTKRQAELFFSVFLRFSGLIPDILALRFLISGGIWMAGEKLRYILLLVVSAAALLSCLSRQTHAAILAIPPLFLFSMLGTVAPSDTVRVSRLSQAVASDGYPAFSAWDSAEPVTFDADWQGKNHDPE